MGLVHARARARTRRVRIGVAFKKKILASPARTAVMRFNGCRCHREFSAGVCVME